MAKQAKLRRRSGAYALRRTLLAPICYSHIPLNFLRLCRILCIFTHLSFRFLPFVFSSWYRSFGIVAVKRVTEIILEAETEKLNPESRVGDKTCQQDARIPCTVTLRC